MAAWVDNGARGRRSQPRALIHVDCMLSRAKGSPVHAHTIDLGPGGMCVATERPLTVDEVLHFDLPLHGSTVDGDARVLREEGPLVYALRFEMVGEACAQTLSSFAR